MTDRLISILVFGALAVHVVGFSAIILRYRIQNLTLNVNLVVAVLLLLAMLTAPPTFRLPLDWQIVGGAIAELLVAGTAIAAWRGSRFAAVASTAIFIAHLILLCAATTFILTFEMNRLF